MQNFEHFRTFFSRSLSSRSEQPDGSVLICPINMRWNDFGHQVQIHIEIKTHDARIKTLSGYVMPEFDMTDEQSAQKSWSNFAWVDELPEFSNSSLKVTPQENRYSFLCLLQNDEAYRDLASWCINLSQRLGILAALNDINFARVSKVITSQQIKQFTSTSVFKHGVMRSAEAYRAYTKGPRFVMSSVLKRITDARQDFKILALLKGFSAHHEIAFKFEYLPTLVSDRIQVVIGKNGTGKTQLLDQFIGSLAVRAENSTTDVFMDRPNSTYSTSEITNPDEKPIDLPNAVLAFSADNASSFPQRSRLDSPLDYSYCSLVNILNRFEENPVVSYPTLGRAIRNLIRDGTLILDRSRFAVFKELMSPIINLSELHLPLRNEFVVQRGEVRDASGGKWCPVDIALGGEQATLDLAAAIDTDRDLVMLDQNRNPYPLSSGQRVFLQFAARALSDVSAGSILVIDEPETHLHPNFISEFMTLLHDLLEATMSIALVATHSPYVVREVPTSCVHVIKLNGSQQPDIRGVYLRTLGASVSSISDAVFGDPFAQKFHNKIAEKIAKESSKSSQNSDDRLRWLLANYGSILNTEMLSTIRHLIEDENFLSGNKDK